MTAPAYMQRQYTVRFLTPAFLGNAAQDGQWRAPPFKALLRHWWRVAVAADCRFDVDEMRRREHALFGTVDGDARKSRVRIRLADWKLGRLTEAPKIGSIGMGPGSLPAAVYSAYGPVVAGPRLKASAAIQNGETSLLSLAFPADTGLERAIALIDRFGTLGGRSRNGWGSISLEPAPAALELPLVNWTSALGRDWAHGLGLDSQGPLIWETPAVDRWEEALRLLAQARKDMRRAVSDRLLLAYPSTKGSMEGWKSTDRVPHSLRFKVRAQGPRYVASVFHLPCRPADELWKKLRPSKQDELVDCFAQAHRFLDQHPQLQRVSA